MLTGLTIRNVGLIEETSVEFQKGLTVLTGETGAGKSMLMDALSLALGARADKSLIRHGAESSMVEARFSVNDDHPSLPGLEELGIPVDDGEINFRRTLTADKSRGFINGATVTQSQMKELGDHLVDIHGQYDHQLILNSKYHTQMLDTFGRLAKETQSVKVSHAQWHRIFDDLNTAKTRIRNQEEEAFLLRAYVDELEALNLQDGEEEFLTGERKRLMNGEKLVAAFSAANQALSADSDVTNQISRAEQELSIVAEDLDPEMSTLYQRLSEASIEVSDITRDIQRLGEHLDPDPVRLQEVDDRLFAIKDCARKHHVTVEELPEVLTQQKRRLNELDNLQDTIDHLISEEKLLRAKFNEACAVLTKARLKAASGLSTEVSGALDKLHMPQAKFAPQLNTKEPEDWNASGAEKVEFMVTTNAGSPMQPLVKVASGGEVSRLMLALKEVFYRAMPETTLVFDEVDTGVGGRVADAMGEALKELSEHHQVMSITHLPQVAAKGTHHVHIHKQTEGGKTHTRLQNLQGESRVDELARMLSGKDITTEAQAAAQKLLA